MILNIPAVILYFGTGTGGAGRCGIRGTFSLVFLSED